MTRATTVFRPGRDAPATRIPALARAADGSLLAFAELRSTRADTGYIALGVRCSTDDGDHWGPIIRIADDTAECARNPVPVVLASGRILLISCVDPAARRPADGPTRVRVQHSDDAGATWSTPRGITDAVRMPTWRWYATGPGAVAPLASGRVLIPANHTEGGIHYAHAIWSDDDGETWNLGGTVASPRSNEGQLAQRPDGSVLLYLRTRAPGSKEFAVSDDEGASWMPGPPARELSGPVCQGDILAIGPELFATGHRHWTQRRGLLLRRSRDGGITWPDAARVRRGASAYSDLADLGDGRLGVLYEHGRRIVFRTIDRARLRPDPRAARHAVRRLRGSEPVL